MRHANITRWVILVIGAQLRVRLLFRPNSKQAELSNRAAPGEAPGILRLRSGQDQSPWQRLRRVDGVRSERRRREHHRRSLLLVECGDPAFAQRAGRHRSFCSGAPRTSARSSRRLSSHSYGTAASATGSRLSAGPSSSISWSKPITPRSKRELSQKAKTFGTGGGGGRKLDAERSQSR